MQKSRIFKETHWLSTWFDDYRKGNAYHSIPTREDSLASECAHGWSVCQEIKEGGASFTKKEMAKLMCEFQGIFQSIVHESLTHIAESSTRQQNIANMYQAERALTFKKYLKELSQKIDEDFL